MEKSSFDANIRVDRIKKIMEEEGIKHQIEFADSIGMEPQNLNRIIKSGKVAERTCRKIVDRFPRYRIEWLLGYDDDMTAVDHLRRLIHNRVDTAEAVNQVVISAADDVCRKKGIPRPKIPIDDFDEIRTRLKDFAELIVSEYIENRETSSYWKRIDKKRRKLK